MPNQNILGQLFFVVFLLCLSTTTTSAQVSVASLSAVSAVEHQGKRIPRKTGPRTKNPHAAGRLRNRTHVVPASRQIPTSLAYKNKRFRRTGKITGNTAPRRKALMGPAYKNRRFKRRKARVARFKRRR